MTTTPEAPGDRDSLFLNCELGRSGRIPRDRRQAPAHRAPRALADQPDIVYYTRVGGITREQFEKQIFGVDDGRQRLAHAGGGELAGFAPRHGAKAQSLRRNGSSTVTTARNARKEQQ